MLLSSHDFPRCFSAMPGATPYPCSLPAFARKLRADGGMGPGRKWIRPHSEAHRSCLVSRLLQGLTGPTCFGSAFSFGHQLGRSNPPPNSWDEPPCGMGISSRLRRTRVTVFLMPAAACKHGKPDACLGGHFKVPDASFWMDGRVRGGELRGEQQRPDAQEAKEVGKVQHAIRALPGFRCDKAARMVSSGPLQSALRGGLELPVFPVAGLTALMGDGADLHQITAQSVDQSHSVLLDVVSLNWLFRVPDVCVFTQFSDRLVQGLRKFLCGHGTVLVDPHYTRRRASASASSSSSTR